MPNASEVRAANQRLRSLGVRPDELTLSPLGAADIWLEGTLIERLDPDYEPKLGAEFVYKTAAISMGIPDAWAAIGKLVPGWHEA
jgi:hypothetical protein